MMKSLTLLMLLVCTAAVASESPSKVRNEMTKAEKQYIDLYNKLNEVEEFDISCTENRATGTTFVNRVCQPRYLTRAKEKSATERMQAAVAAGESTGQANSRGPDVGAASVGGGATVVMDKNEAFRKNLLEVLQKSPELQELARKRDELQARYRELSAGK
jgi:hypothetical protein